MIIDKIVLSENKYPVLEDGIYRFYVYDYKEKYDIHYKLIVNTILYTDIEKIDYMLVFPLRKRSNKRFINFLHSINVKRLGEPYYYNPEEIIGKSGFVRIINNYPVDFIYIPL